MSLTNRERVGRALGLLADGLAGPVDDVMRKSFGVENWNELWAAQDAQPGRKPLRYSKSDSHILLKAITHHEYGKKFNPVLKWHQRAWASELADIRNLWAHNEPISDDDAARTLDTIGRLLEAVGAARQARDVRKLRLDAQRVLVGKPAEIGGGYQRRGFDAEIERLWAAGGDRRLWLTGGPGFGKSYSARRVMQDSLANHESDRDDLLVWVDSADMSSVTAALAAAVDHLRQHQVAVPGTAKDPADRKARALLEILATSTWRWLIVLDNADAAQLIEAGLIPTGSNPNGRVLLTTLSPEHRVRGNGQVVSANLFTPEEADTYLRREVHFRGRGNIPLSQAPTTETAELAKAVGHHPLALSIAASTIVANAMDIADWIAEFKATAVMDAAADEADKGGYPHLIGATWQLALEKASKGLPKGVVERAAMVAALQDPDGHPTWLWERDSLTRWVAGGSVLARRHGVPVAVQRLIDHGIVELHGATWKQGRLGIHQLAARAVRELAAAATLGELAASLADEWLLQLTENEAAARPEAIQGNLRPIAALRGLPRSTRLVVGALLGLRSLPNPRFLAWRKENLEDLTVLLAQGGTIGRARLAIEYFNIGTAEEELERHEEAISRYTHSAQIYVELLQDRSLHDDLRAEYLMNLGLLEEKLGQSNQARESLTQAAIIFERLIGTNTGDDLGQNLVCLLELYEKLGSREKIDFVLGRAEDLLNHATADDPIDTDELAVYQHAESWVKLGRQLRALGRLSEAKGYLARAAASYQQSGWESFAADTILEVARIDIAMGQWDQAEDSLARLVMDDSWDADHLIFLASIQMHRGRTDDARRTLELGADEYLWPEVQADDDAPAGDDEASRAHEAEINRLLLARLHSEAMTRHRWADAVGLAAAALDVTQKLAEAEPGEHEAELAEAHYTLGLSYQQLGRLDEAAAHFTDSLGIRQVLAELDTGNDEAKEDFADALVFLGATMLRLGKPEVASDYAAGAVNAFQQLADVARSDEAVRGLSFGLITLGAANGELGLQDEAIDCYTRNVDLWRSVADQSPGDRNGQSKLADAYHGLGSAYQKFGRLNEALNAVTRSASIREVLAAQDPRDQETQQSFAEALDFAGSTHLQLGAPQAAAKVLSQSVGFWKDLAQGDPGDRQTQGNLATTLAVLGVAFAGCDRLDDAADHLTRSVNIRQLLAELDPGKHERHLIHALRVLADVLRDLGEADEAEQAAARADEVDRSFPDPDSTRG